LLFGIGAMVGESSILANAGSHLGALHDDHAYIQGYSHRLLHKLSLANGGLRLQRQGMLSISDKIGLGLKLDNDILNKITMYKETIRL
jgi:hypothetical protein